MSDMLANGHKRHQRPGPGKRQYLGYDTAKPPTEAEIAEQTLRQQEEHSLYAPSQLAHVTRPVRLEISFEQGRLYQTREQAKMIIEAMQQVVLATRSHMISLRGETSQRIAARREAAACARALNILNGRQKAK